MSFADLKKQSSLGSLTSKLVKEVEKMNNTSSGGDDRLWKPEMDKTGNGYAVIRFLPAPEGEELPWAKMYSCLLYTSPSPRDATLSRMPSSA